MADAERWALTTDVPGVGRKGDVVIYDPGASNPRYRLAVVSPRGRGNDLGAYLDALERTGHDVSRADVTRGTLDGVLTAEDRYPGDLKVHRSAFRVAEPVELPGRLVMEPGDVVIHLNGNQQWRRDALKVPVQQVPRSAFPALAEAVSKLEPIPHRGSREGLRRYLTNRMVLSGKDDTSPIFVCHPNGATKGRLRLLKA